SPPDREKADYVFYALPKTVIETKLTIQRTLKTPGKYAVYTPTLFPEIDSDDYVTSKRIALKFSDPGFSSFPVPDMAEIYRIKVRKPWAGLFGDLSINLNMNEEGVIEKVEASASNAAAGVVSALARVGAGYLPLGGGLGTGAGSNKSTLADAAIQSMNPASREALEMELAALVPEYAGLDSEYQDRAIMFYKAVRDTSLVDAFRKLAKSERIGLLLSAEQARRWLRLAPQTRELYDGGDPEALFAFLDSFAEAEKRAAEIQELQKAFRKNITTACCAEASVAELKTEIARLLEDFVGTTQIKSWTPTFSCEPSNDATKFSCNPDAEPCDVSSSTGSCIQKLIEYSATQGVCASHLGVQVPVDFALPGCTATDDVYVEFAQPDGIYRRIDGWYQTPSFTDKTGFRYRMPAMLPAAVINSAGDRELGRAAIAVAQLGYVATLPRSTGSRKTQFVLDLHSSGALKNFQVASEARIQASDLDAGQAALDAYLERRREREQAAASPDELDELERQRKLLEEQVLIQRYETELETGVAPPQ
ncbi:MAG: DUF4831 family protein, partial [Acidobacteria bacterium]|nr:DUF4831 family protein [Acidobacteriota bacterium]